MNLLFQIVWDNISVLLWGVVDTILANDENFVYKIPEDGH